MYFKSIKFNPYPDEWKSVLKEDAKTFLHNLWTRNYFGFDFLNFKKINPLDVFTLCCMLPWAAFVPFQISILIGSMYFKYKFNPLDRIDRSYFFSNYNIPPSLEKKLLNIIKTKYNKYPKKAVRFDISKKYDGYGVKGDFADFQNYNKGKVDITSKKGLGEMIGEQITTTSTYWNLMDGKSNLYILYFKFDSHQIYNCYVVTYGNSDGTIACSGFDLTDIKEFHNINPKEYTKE